MALHVLQAAMAMVRQLRAPLAALARADADLASQLRRAASSVPLNIAEGSKRSGRDQAHHFRIAAGSAKEVTACLSVAEAWGYLGADSIAGALSEADRVLAMLWRLTH